MVLTDIFLIKKKRVNQEEIALIPENLLQADPDLKLQKATGKSIIENKTIN